MIGSTVRIYGKGMDYANRRQRVWGRSGACSDSSSGGGNLMSLGGGITGCKDSGVAVQLNCVEDGGEQERVAAVEVCCAHWIG